MRAFNCTAQEHHASSDLWGFKGAQLRLTSGRHAAFYTRVIIKARGFLKHCSEPGSSGLLGTKKKATIAAPYSLCWLAECSGIAEPNRSRIEVNKTRGVVLTFVRKADPPL